MSVDLKVDFCSHEAAKYAVEHWHYSESMPSAKTLKIGAWEGDQFISAIIYGWGANRNMGSPWDLKIGEVVELVRVALTKHDSQVSQIVSRASKLLRVHSPGVRCLLSYADPCEGHHGGIYQAMNWIYVGVSQGSEKVWYNGRWAHKRTVDSRYGNHKGFKVMKVPGKHTYLYPLDKAMRRQIEPLSKPYPKRADVGEIESR